MRLYFSQLRMMAALNTGIAAISSLAQLQVQDRRQCTQNKLKYQKQAATCDAYSVTNRLRMASRRALEWIEMFKGLAGFKI